MKVDAVVIGQGLAGSILAYQLMRKGLKVHLFDETSGATASRQATGLINPITGRRIVKSWLIDQLMPYAATFYQEVTDRFQIQSFQKTKLVKALKDIEQWNDFQVRLNDPIYAKYLAEWNDEISPSLTVDDKHYQVNPILQIDIAELLDAFGNFFQSNDAITRAKIDYQNITIENDAFYVNKLSAKYLFFADGYLMRDNPYFNYLPIRFSKGEALIVRCNDLNLTHIYSNGITITPIGNNQYYIGSSYDWKDDTLMNTAEKINFFKQQFEKICKAPYELIQQKVGLRPTTVNRRPFVGEHPAYKNMFVLNGFGTKGLSLAPYFSNQLIEYIFAKKPIHEEASIRKYDKLIHSV